MGETRTLLHLEYEWRVFCKYKMFINLLVKMKMSLSSPIMCMLKNKLDKHGILVSKLKSLYEEKSGKIIVFYEKDDI